ncbi:MAG: hypothetical protein F6K23_37275 [Okeania sp. SIO2C9]|uniref:hypothetical protein n=1 Tax=Okeania sp. SIO2C9 TaxID=2607791 RepID=UPI0013C00FF1|nr:hypothetical protein [Okeania sp. SIO2C9]NEQ78150.1 hypothetical protein [Okeania sp. SIO2C9]
MFGSEWSDRSSVIIVLFSSAYHKFVNLSNCGKVRIEKFVISGLGKQDYLSLKQRNNRYLQRSNSLQQYLPLDFSTIYSITQRRKTAKSLETSLAVSEKFSPFLS